MRAVRVISLVVALAWSLVVAIPSPTQAASTELTLANTYRSAPYESSCCSFTNEHFSSVAVGDVDGNGTLDIVVGGLDGRLRAWSVGAAQPFLNIKTGSGAIHASPALVDITGNGVLDIVVGNSNGRVLAVTGRGEVVFDRHDTGFPISGIFGTPAVGDLDRDGQLEIVATSFDHHIHAWNLDGSYVPGFPRFIYDTNWSSPVLADIDNDGWLEIIAGGDIDPPCPNPGGTCNQAANDFNWSAGGLLWVLRHDASIQPGFPINIAGQTLWSDPSLADLDGDNHLDIVIGTGTNFGGNPENGRRVYAYRYDGRPVAGWPARVDGQVMGSPAIGDLDGDGSPDVAVLSSWGRIYAFNSDASNLWDVCNGDRGWNANCDKSEAMHGTVAIADIDDDGVQEVVNMAEHVMSVYSGPDGHPEDRHDMPSSIFAPAASPTVVEVDGATHILQAVTQDRNGSVSRDAGDELQVLDFTTGTGLGRSDWPMFGRDAARTGYDIDAFNSLGFIDALDSPFMASIDWLADQGITSGCTAFPKAFCPDELVTRAQMATFLVRAFDIAAAPSGYQPFVDDAGVHQASIRALASSGVTSGCTANRYCPDDFVTRAQMATFLVRAFGLAAIRTDYFDDDGSSAHQANINALAESGITTGCKVGVRSFCPVDPVTREQMAAFLHRGFT